MWMSNVVGYFIALMNSIMAPIMGAVTSIASMFAPGSVFGIIYTFLNALQSLLGLFP